MGALPDSGAVLFILDSVAGGAATNYVRALIHREMFERDGWRVEYADYRPAPRPYDRAALRRKEEEIVAAASRFDLVYLAKVPSLRLVRALHERTKARVIFDLTDALWREYLHGWQDLDAILAEVDAVFSENECVCGYGRRWNSWTVAIPSHAPVEKFDAALAARPARTDDRVILGWIGSPSTLSGLASIRRPLEGISARYPQAELRVVGHGSESLRFLENIRHTARAAYDETIMVAEVIGMDIGLFPAPRDLDDYRARGALKALIYMAGGVPPVCLNAGDCARIVQDGVNGMLVNERGEWERKISQLIEDAALRSAMGQRARERVRTEHSLAAVYSRLQRELLNVIRQTPPAGCAPNDPRRAPGTWSMRRIVGHAWARLRGR